MTVAIQKNDVILRSPVIFHFPRFLLIYASNKRGNVSHRGHDWIRTAIFSFDCCIPRQFGRVHIKFHLYNSEFIALYLPISHSLPSDTRLQCWRLYVSSSVGVTGDSDTGKIVKRHVFTEKSLRLIYRNDDSISIL